MSRRRPCLHARHGLLQLLASLASASTLPYNPTHLFYPTQNSSLLYMLSPPSTDSPQGNLQSLHIGGSIDASSPAYHTVSPSLPFLQDGSSAYTPSIDPNGAISVYTGKCTDAANASQIWHFTTDTTSNSDGGSWVQNALTFSAGGSQGSTQIGPNFLASSISFSPTTLAKDTSVYVFGGMCPQPSTTEENWQSAANYSNQMLVFQPGRDKEIDYTLVPSRGQPIAEAGFTITGLQPTTSTSSSGIQSQQQNFLLLGGHTRTAFINMSQVAVFSLPQNAWTFLPVQQVANSIVEPRSGHTALLSNDSSKVIIVGGWVGNTTNLAEPQVAILHVGEGYGGTGAWSWSEPNLVGSPFADGSGIYGHGSVMLPGNIMMVAGGHDIQASGTKHKRAIQPASSKTYFYNVSSNSWLSSYPGVNSAVLNPMTQAATSSGALGTTSQKVGLGAGLPLGIAAVGCAIVIAWLYWRRLKRKRQEVRDRQLRERDVYTHHAGTSATRPMEQNPFADPHQTNTAVVPPPLAMMRTSHTGPGATNSSFGAMRSAERSGLDLNLPSPNRGLRKGRYYSGQYSNNVAAPDDRRASRNSAMGAPMPAFDEREEAEDDAQTPMLPRPTSDPFVDPPPALQISAADEAIMSERPLSPSEQRQQEMASWVSNWESAAQALYSPSPPPSPTRSEDGFVRRKALAYDYLDANKPRSGLISGSIKRARRSPRPEHQGHSRDTSHTEHDSLLGRPGSIRLDPDTTPTFTTGDPNNRGTSRLGSILGSVRRNVSGAVGWRSASATATPYNTSGFSGIDVSMIEPYHDEPQSSTTDTSSPTKGSSMMWSEQSSTVKRSVSNPSAAPWAIKKGAHDWVADAEPRTRAMTMQARDSGDWDPEEAVRDRVVQLMFTVPKGELRVVNADVDRDSISEGASRARDDDDLQSVSVYSPAVPGGTWESLDQGLGR